MFSLNSLSKNALGHRGEQLARFIIRQKTCLDSVKSIPYHGDLVLSNGLYIEVKTIRKNKDGSYKATIRKGKNQHLGKSNFVFLQLVEPNDEIRYFIIPAEMITTNRITISGNIDRYNGKLRQYYNRFDFLTQVN